MTQEEQLEWSDNEKALIARSGENGGPVYAMLRASKLGEHGIHIHHYILDALRDDQVTELGAKLAGLDVQQENVADAINLDLLARQEGVLAMLDNSRNFPAIRNDVYSSVGIAGLTEAQVLGTGMARLSADTVVGMLNNYPNIATPDGAGLENVALTAKIFEDSLLSRFEIHKAELTPEEHISATTIIDGQLAGCAAGISAAYAGLRTRLSQ